LVTVSLFYIYPHLVPSKIVVVKLDLDSYEKMTYLQVAVNYSGEVAC
jgi:hypothetical protein